MNNLLSKKIIVIFLNIISVCFIFGCGNKKDVLEGLTETAIETSDDSAISDNTTTLSDNHANYSSDNKKTSSDDLLDEFLSGNIPAYCNNLYVRSFDESVNDTPTAKESPFYISELTDSEDETERCTFKERADIDNDGKDELVFITPYYGEMYIDAYNGDVYMIAEGQSTAECLSYTNHNGDTWIVYSDTTHGGRYTHQFYKLDGNEHFADSFTLYAEWDYETPINFYNKDSIFYYNDEKISMEEYESIYNEFFENDITDYRKEKEAEYAKVDKGGDIELYDYFDFKNFPYNAISDMEKYGITFKNDEIEDLITCYDKSGKKVMEICLLDVGSVEYIEKAEGISIFSLTPGMTTNQVYMAQKKWGLLNSNVDTQIYGDEPMSIYVYDDPNREFGEMIQIKYNDDGTIKSISLLPYDPQKKAG